MTIAEALRALEQSGQEVEFNIRVRARIIQVSDSHGACARLQIEQRDYRDVSGIGAPRGAVTDPRCVWLDEDEIIEIQP